MRHGGWDHRGMLGDPRHLTYRERVAKGGLFSPRIYTSGPSFNGKTAATKELAVEAVAAQKTAGYDLLKIHPGVPRDAFDALVAKANEVGLPFAGHVPAAVGLHRALDARYRSIDHLDGYVEALARNPSESITFGVNLMAQLDESKLPALVQRTKEAGTWQVPTQILLEHWLDDADPEAMARWPEMKHVEQEMLTKWIAKKQQPCQVPGDGSSEVPRAPAQMIKALQTAAFPLRRLGCAADLNVPGFSAHRELKTYVASGLAISSAQTGTATRYLFRYPDDSRHDCAGRRADLVSLTHSPRGIGNTSRSPASC